MLKFCFYNKTEENFSRRKVFQHHHLAFSATVDIDPDTLNLKSNGQLITAYITLPEGYSVEDIVLETVEVEGIPAEWGEIQNGVLMVKVDRVMVQNTLTGMIDYEEGVKFYDIELTVTGELTDGTPFEGNDTIRIILPITDIH